MGKHKTEEGEEAEVFEPDDKQPKRRQEGGDDFNDTEDD